MSHPGDEETPEPDGHQETKVARLAALIPSGDGRLFLLGIMGGFLRNKYERTGDLEDLQRAVTHSEEAVAALPQGHSSRPSFLAELASTLGMKYTRMGDIHDLQRAISYAEEAMAAIPHDNPYRATQLPNLAGYLVDRYKRTGDLDDLQQAILYAEEAIATLQNDGRTSCLSNLACYLGDRYKRVGDMDDLKKAISYGEEVVAATPSDQLTRVGRLSNLANRLADRYGRVGDLEDLQKAISYTEEVVAVIPEHHPDRAIYLSNLSNNLIRRYSRIGNLDGLQQALIYAEEAIAETPRDNPDRVGRLSNLAMILNEKYKRMGDINDLQQAISCAEEAAVAVGQDHPDRAIQFSNLAGSLRSRYNRTGDLEDLEQAILYAEEAVAATPQDHPDRVRRLSNLATSLSIRYIRMEDMNDLERTILYAEEVVSATPHDHPDQATYLSNLAKYLGDKYRTGDLETIQKATLYAQKAVAATPEGDPDREGRLFGLANRLNDKYKRIGDMEDLEQAILYAEEAVAATPQDHPGRANRLYALGHMLHQRSQRLGTVEDLPRNIDIYYEAWNCRTSPPTIRILAAREAARYLSLNGEWEKASLLLEDSVKMLSKVSPRSLGQKDQGYMLLDLNGLAAEAASLALEARSTAYHALRLLELSRGIIMGFAIDYRGDLSDLEATDPELSKRFNGLRTEIDTPLLDRASDLPTGTESSLFNREVVYHQGRTHALQRRETAIREMEETLAEIRKLPGHEEFQLPPPAEELMSMANNGPIVTFVSSHFRSDAIIVTSSSISALPLPDLLFDEIPNRLGPINKPSKRSSKRSRKSLLESAEKNKKMREMLLWLWDVAVEPVLQELKLAGPTSNKDTKPTHIWWIGVGALSIAPFHAAGDHSSNSSRNTLNYAISSYTPTIKALSYARERKFGVVGKPGNITRLLLVTMPRTPGWGDLPDAEKETSEILDVTKRLVTTKHLERPSADKVLEELGSYQAMHFACHGVTDVKDPSNSHLVLLKDSDSRTGNETADKLTIQDISLKNTKSAQIAYLSACSTAYNPAVELADEVIHIASGFQLAGFSHVLATMWPSETNVCKEVAVDFYRSLFNGQDSDEGHRKVSMAFHDAVKRARDKSPLLPCKWAPFIHMGA